MAASSQAFQKFVECRRTFHHHQPITKDVMKLNTIGGGNGAFRSLVEVREGDPKQPTVGVSIMFSPTGQVFGSKLLMCGSFDKISKIRTVDIFGDTAETPGSVNIDDFDISIFSNTNGMMTSAWTKPEENLIPWKMKVTQDGHSKPSRNPNIKIMGLTKSATEQTTNQHQSAP